MFKFNLTLRSVSQPENLSIGGTSLPEGNNNGLAPATFKCAYAGIAVAGYAIAGWPYCECYTNEWTAQEKDPYLIPHGECET